MFNSLFLHVQPLPSPHTVHVFSGLVIRVGFLTEVSVLFLGRWDPIRVNIYNLEKKKQHLIFTLTLASNRREKGKLSS